MNNNIIKYVITSILLSSSMVLSSDNQYSPNDASGNSVRELKRSRESDTDDLNCQVSRPKKMVKKRDMQSRENPEAPQTSQTPDIILTHMLENLSAVDKAIPDCTFSQDQVKSILQAMVKVEERIYNKYKLNRDALLICDLYNLPKEILYEILNCFKGTEINILRQVSKKLRDIITPPFTNDGGDNRRAYGLYVKVKFDPRMPSVQKHEARLADYSGFPVATLDISGRYDKNKVTNLYQRYFIKFGSSRVRTLLFDSNGAHRDFKEAVVSLASYRFLEKLVLRNYSIEYSHDVLHVIPHLEKLKHLELQPLDTLRPICITSQYAKDLYKLSPDLETLIISPYYEVVIDALADHKRLKTLEMKPNNPIVDKYKYPVSYKQAINSLPSLSTLKFNVTSSMIEELGDYAKLSVLCLSIGPDEIDKLPFYWNCLEDLNHLTHLSLKVHLVARNLKDADLGFERWQKMKKLKVLDYQIIGRFKSESPSSDMIKISSKLNEFNRVNPSVHVSLKWIYAKDFSILNRNVQPPVRQVLFPQAFVPHAPVHQVLFPQAFVPHAPVHQVLFPQAFVPHAPVHQPPVHQPPVHQAQVYNNIPNILILDQDDPAIQDEVDSNNIQTINYDDIDDFFE